MSDNLIVVVAAASDENGTDAAGLLVASPSVKSPGDISGGATVDPDANPTDTSSPPKVSGRVDDGTPVSSLANGFVKTRAVRRVFRRPTDGGGTLTPITEIAVHMTQSSLSDTPKRGGTMLAGEEGAATPSDPDQKSFTWPSATAGTSTDTNTSMIASNFTLNSGGRSPAMRRAEARARGAQRRLNIAPIRMTFDENTVVEKSTNLTSDEMSFYDANSPQNSPRSCSISPCMDMEGLYSPESSPSHFNILSSNNTTNGVPLSERRSFGDLDYNSVDSGYGASSSTDISTSSRICFKFAEPAGVAPKRPNELSPPKMLGATSSSSSLTPPKSSSCFRPFNSVSSDSIDSMDDDYMELLDMESMEEETNLPTHFNSIISGDIKSSPRHMTRPAAPRRCLSLIENTVAPPKTPEILKTVTTENSSTTPFSSRAFKRPEAPAFSPTQSKRFKCESAISEDKENVIAIPSIAPTQVRHILRKSISMNDANIMSALARSSSEPDLIGDFSKPFCLPLMTGRHRDLKSISHETMAKLLRGDYDDSVASFRIVDCRYPYEFEGGHIAGAENLYTQEEILNTLVKTKPQTASVVPEGPKRDIIVFHCEFSSERGPKLSRFLRSHDRQCNNNVYPALHYPEIYLLHGGYKDFFEANAELCSPIAYRPMLDPDYGSAYKHFRAQTKSWSGDAKTAATANRLVKSRSRLVL